MSQDDDNNNTIATTATTAAVEMSLSLSEVSASKQQLLSELESIFMSCELLMQSASIDQVSLHSIHDVMSLFKQKAEDQLEVIPSVNQSIELKESSHSLCFNEKQIMRLLVLTGTEQAKLAKTYICAHLWADLFENRIIEMAAIESVRVLVNVINVIANMLQKLHGIAVANRLSVIIHSSVDYLLQQGELGSSYDQFLRELKVNPLISESRVTNSLNQHSKRIIGLAASDDINDKIQAVNIIFDLLSDCMSYEQQITLFSSQITNLLKDLVRIPLNLNGNEDIAKELLILLSKLVLALLVNPAVDIEINPEDILQLIGKDADKNVEYVRLAKDASNKNAGDQQQNEIKQQQRSMGNVIRYEIKGIRQVITRSQRIYSNVALIVNSLLLLPNDNEIMRYCLQILVSLFKLFPEFRENLRVPLLSVLQNISKIAGDAVESASIFLFELMNRSEMSDEVLIGQIQANADIMELTKLRFYSDRYITATPFNKNILKLEDIVIHKTFAIQEKIEAEKAFTSYIEIESSWSIVYIGFATHMNDIKVHLNLEEDFTNSPHTNRNTNNKSNHTPPPYTILTNRVACEQDPHRIILFVEQPGIYSITFDNTYSWFNSKQLRYRSLTLVPSLTSKNPAELKQRILYRPLHFDTLNLSLFKKFDANWCELHLLSYSTEIDIITADKQSFRDVITSRDLKLANDAVQKRFPAFTKLDYFSILIIYEQHVWTEVLAHYTQSLIETNVLTREEVEERRTSREFQLSLYQRLMQEKLPFLQNFKTLSMEAVEDVNYFWFKQGSHLLSLIEDDNEYPAEQAQIVLIVKCNPATKVFCMKLYQNDMMHGVKLEDLDEDLFGLCETLLTEKDPEDYFIAFCDFMKSFLIAHQQLGIHKVVLYVDPSNLFWSEEKFKLFQNYLKTQLPELPRIPLLIQSSI